MSAATWPIEPTVWPAPVRGVCPCCGEEVQLRSNGTLALHWRTRLVGSPAVPLAEDCPGTGRLPKRPRVQR